MARIRTIKPEFWTSEQVADCSTTARLLFVGMWNFCDDGGVHPASIKRLKMEVFPGDAVSEKQLQGFVDELLKAGLIRQYSVNGDKFWNVTGWHHQKIEKPSCKYPGPDKADKFDDQSTTNRQTLDDGSPPEGNGREGSLKEGKVEEGSNLCPAGSGPHEVLSVFEHYRTYHPKAHPSPVATSKEWKAIAARIKEGYSTVDLRKAIDGCHRSDFHCGQNDRGEKYQALELIMRNGGQVAKFIEIADAPKGAVLSQKTQRSLLAAESWANRGGSTDAGK